MKSSWKKKKTGEVIHQIDYNNLSDKHKANYEETSADPTHQVVAEESNGDPVLAMLEAMLAGAGAEGKGDQDQDAE